MISISSRSIWTVFLSLTAAAAAAQPSPPTATATVAPEAAFQKFATQRAAAQKQYIEAWYSINLDEDPAPEMVAVLCSDEHGAYLIEKGGKQRWEIGFDVDGETGVCQERPQQPPKWEQKKGSTIKHEQSHHGGYAQTSFALRAGAPVVVKGEGLNDVRSHDKVKRFDFDKLVKSGKRKIWPAPDDAKCSDEGWCDSAFTLTVVSK